MKLAELLKAVDVIDAVGSTDVPVSGIVGDSRRVRAGYVFVAMPGLQNDGWSFVGEAVERGAIAVVSEHTEPIKRSICHIRVSDARDAAARLAAEFFERPADKLQCIGITGTNGKTTTAYMVRNILRAADHRPGILSTVQYEIGERTIPATQTTPDPVVLQSLLAQMVAADCRSVVMEVSSHALDQKRVAGLEFDVAVFANLTRDHLDYHGSMEEYYEAKCRLFRQLCAQERPSTAVVNIDDPWGRKLADAQWLSVDKLTYGLGDQGDVRAESVVLSPEGSQFTVCTPWANHAVHLNVLGRYNISNALAATAVCGSIGIPIDVAVEVLFRMEVVPGRLQEVKTDLGFQVFVDYAHTDDALEHVLTTLREITRHRLIVVFGCGGNRDRSKRPLMGAVASRLADLTILTSDNPRKEEPSAIISEIRAGIDDSAPVETIADRHAAIARAVALATDGDVVLIAGKGHETFQEFANKTVPFDDTSVVRQCLQQTQTPEGR